MGIHAINYANGITRPLIKDFGKERTAITQTIQKARITLNNGEKTLEPMNVIITQVKDALDYTIRRIKLIYKTKDGSHTLIQKIYQRSDCCVTDLPEEIKIIRKLDKDTLSTKTISIIKNGNNNKEFYQSEVKYKTNLGTTKPEYKNRDESSLLKEVIKNNDKRKQAIYNNKFYDAIHSGQLVPNYNPESTNNENVSVYFHKNGMPYYPSLDPKLAENLIKLI